MGGISDTNITVGLLTGQRHDGFRMMNTPWTFQSTNYDDLKAVSDQLAET